MEVGGVAGLEGGSREQEVESPPGFTAESREDPDVDVDPLWAAERIQVEASRRTTCRRTCCSTWPPPNPLVKSVIGTWRPAIM